MQRVSLSRREMAASSEHERALRSELVTVTFLLTLSLCCLDANLLVILLQSCEIFTRLGEFSFFHAFSDIPVDEGAFRVHEIELVVDAREHLSNGRGVADHTY